MSDKPALELLPGTPVQAIRLEPGWYLFLVDPFFVPEPEILFRALGALEPDIRGALVPVPPGNMDKLTEEEARWLWRALRQRFGTHPEKEEAL